MSALALPAEGCGFASALIALTAPTVVLSIGIQDFPPKAAARHPHAGIVTRHRCEVEHGQDDFACALRLAQES